MKTAGLAAVALALGFLLQAERPAWSAAATAAADGGIVLAENEKPESDPGAATGAEGDVPERSAAPGPADAPGTPLSDCKLRCGEQCQVFGDPGLQAQCRGSCETKCTATYGQ